MLFRSTVPEKFLGALYVGSGAALGVGGGGLSAGGNVLNVGNVAVWDIGCGEPLNEGCGVQVLCGILVDCHIT